jgi:hypothetical protein
MIDGYPISDIAERLSPIDIVSRRGVCISSNIGLTVGIVVSDSTTLSMSLHSANDEIDIFGWYVEIVQSL